MLSSVTLAASLAAFFTRLSAASSIPLIDIRANEVWPSSIAGEAHGKNWVNFTEATERWSSYAAPTFNEVFIPKDEHDLSIGLQYLTSHKLPFLTKAGGHGYPTTLDIIQNGTLINMENFNYARLQNNGSVVNGTLVVGPGALFGDMIDALSAGGREMTVGSCACVGAGGATLGGGLGRLQGLHGLTSDALRAVRIALWNGTIIEASNQVNSDLFWGIRGSGQNYGVITQFVYQTYPATNGGQIYNADMTFSKASIGPIVETINNLTTAGLDSKVAFLTYFALNPANNEFAVILDIVYAGPMSEGQKYTKMFSSYSQTLVENEYPWADLPTRSVLGLIPASCADGPRYDLYSNINKVLDPPTFIEFGNEFEQFLQQYPLANGSALQIETFALQGIQALPDDYSAFPHRQHFQSQVESVGRYTDDSVAEAVDSFFKKWRNTFATPKINGYDKFYIYQNYGHGDEPLSAIYGYSENRHQRLTNLKNAYDPHGFFDAYHPIPTSLAGWN